MTIPEHIRAALSASYRVERELTGGGMARVFVGEDLDLGRQVVIKILPRDLAASVSAERFRREILTVARLQHPHIVGVLKAGEIDGVPYFVMPYVDGESVDIRLKRFGPLSARDTIGIMKDVARALAFAHERGVVHRDIKPGNILLAAGSATVTDFGVAKALSSAMRSGESRAAGLTHTGISLGTLLYMAPEQAAGDPDIDGRADIYSLGITAYEMLAGVAPFADLSPREMLTARLTQPPPPLSTRREDVPEGLELLIAQCLAIDPADRPQTAAELVQLLEDPGVVSGAFESTGRSARLRRAPRKVGKGVIAALALVGAIAVSAGIYTKTHPNTAAAEVAVVDPSKADEGVIAVLPFVNIGPDSTNAYLAAGVTNAVAGRLSRAEGLRVISPSRATAFRGDDTTAQKGLNARFVLEGTVEKSGNRIRVTARLSTTADDVMRWADVYDRDAGDIFKVEDELASAIVASVAPMAAPTQPTTAEASASLPPGLYDVFLRARYDLASRTPSALRRAVTSFKRVTKEAPTYAPGFAGLAEAYTLLPQYAAVSHDSVRDLAADAAARAIRLDSTMAEGYAARALSLSADWQWAAAERDFRRAIALDSMSAAARQWYAEQQLVLGNSAAAVADLVRAAKLDPSSPVLAGSLALALVHAGRAADAVKQARRAMEMDPSLPGSHFTYGGVLLFAGRAREALPSLEQAVALDPDSRRYLGMLGYGYAAAGEKAKAAAILARVERMPSGMGREAAIARIRMGLGDVEGALGALENAAGLHDPFFSSAPLAAAPFTRLGSDPRFQKVAQVVGVRPQILTRF